MLLADIMQYCGEKRWVDTVAIATHFNRDVTAIEGLLSVLEQKQLVKPLVGGCGPQKCGNCTVGCSSTVQPTKRYIWVG